MRILFLVLIAFLNIAPVSANATEMVVESVKSIINSSPIKNYSDVHFTSTYYLDDVAITDHASQYMAVCEKHKKLHIAKAFSTHLIKKINKLPNIDFKKILNNLTHTELKKYGGTISSDLINSKEAGDLLLLISGELLKYHEKIIETKNWRKKLKNIEFNKNKHISFEGGVVFHKAGFPFPESPCYVSPVGFDDENGRLHYTEFDATLDAWLYSFWYRRFKEETFEITNLLINIVISTLSNNKF